MRGRGGLVENVLYEDIYVANIEENAIDITMYYKVEQFCILLERNSVIA